MRLKKFMSNKIKKKQTTILIYTGLRIGELLHLEKKDIHLNDRWFFVKKSKTESEVREVPIAEKKEKALKFLISRLFDFSCILVDLPLAELRSTPRCFETVLLSFLHAGISC